MPTTPCHAGRSASGKKERNSVQGHPVPHLQIGDRERKAITNQARLLKHKREDNGRVRFLNQFSPAKTEVDYLKPRADEESRLRAVIQAVCPGHMPKFDIAFHTGMRPSEQYGLTWDRVDLVRKLVTIPKSKSGITRHIPLNSVSLAAFQSCSGAPVEKGARLLIFMGGLEGVQTLV